MTTDSKRTSPVKLFESVPNTDYGRLIVRYPFQDDAVFAFSYKESADRLASTFKGDAPDDLMLLPFLTLYRQAYELQLKVIVHFLAGYAALTKESTEMKPTPRRSICASRRTLGITFTNSSMNC
jgi:hypothetical protein